MTYLQLFENIGLTALMVAVVLGGPISAYQSLHRTPRRFVMWPIYFAGAGGALAVLLNILVRVVAHFAFHR